MNLKLIGLILIIASCSTIIEAAGPRMNYKCLYVHNLIDDQDNIISSHITFSDEVILPSLCPPPPATKHISVDIPAEVENKVTLHSQATNATPAITTKFLDDDPAALRCTHQAKPPIYTPLR